MATRRFRAVLAQENVETQEGWLIREFPAGCFSWRALPLTLMAQTTTPMLGGHGDAFIFARIDSIDREGDFVVGIGTADDGGEGVDAERRRDTAHLIDTQMLNGISVDPGGVEVTETCEQWNEDEPDWCDVVRLRFDMYEIGAATLTTVPALGGTLIEWIDADWVDEDAADGESADADGPDEAAVAAAASISIAANPPLSHFDDPELTELTRIPVVTADGRVYGHLASWADCHISFPTHCQPPWHSETDYAYAHVCEFPGGVLNANGVIAGLATMPITVRGGHYPTDDEHARRWRDAQAHYDDPENVAAYVRVYEDEIGIAFSGALRPGLDPSMLATFAGHRQSTDHRRIPPGSGSMELVGACSINVPGFVRAVSMVASGGPGTALDTPVAAVIGGSLQGGDRSCCDSCAHGQPCADAVAASAAPSAEDRLARLERGVERLLSSFEPEMREQAIARLRTGVRA